MKNKPKEITLNDIAELIQTSANETTRALESKIEASASELATMTQEQFLELGSTMREVVFDVKEIKGNLNKKVDKIEHNTLEYRVEKLEEKYV